MRSLVVEELSIGNLVKANLTGEFISVDWINIKHIIDGNRQCIPYDMSEVYSAIPISEDWILRLGGVKGNNADTYWLPNRIGIWFEKAGVLSDTDGWYWGDTFIKMEYIHELQNLYFLLTKNRLEIK